MQARCGITDLSRLTSHDLGELLDRPIQIGRPNDQRWRNPQDHVVGFFAQHTLLRQGFAERTGTAV